MIDKSKLTIGSDPEFFCEVDGEIVSSIGIIPGDKYSIVKVEEFFVFKDNVLVEGNIPPAKSKEEFVGYMKGLKKVIKTYFDVTTISKNSHAFTKAQLRDSEANIFGCEAYSCAWDAKGIEIHAADLSKYMSRTAGFHIHIGYTLTSDAIAKKDMNLALARAFDYFCVIPAREKAPDSFRDENYGALGSYRDKPYGLEVRGLGAFFSQDEYLEWVYDRTIDSIDYCSIQENVNKLLSLESEPAFTGPEYQQLGIDYNKIKLN